MDDLQKLRLKKLDADVKDQMNKLKLKMIQMKKRWICETEVWKMRIVLMTNKIFQNRGD